MYKKQPTPHIFLNLISSFYPFYKVFKHIKQHIYTQILGIIRGYLKNGFYIIKPTYDEEA